MYLCNDTLHCFRIWDMKYICSISVDIGVGRVVRWRWVSFQFRGVLLSWIRVGQGPTALAIGAGEVVWTFLLSSIIFLFFLPLSGRMSEIDLNTVSEGR